MGGIMQKNNISGGSSNISYSSADKVRNILALVTVVGFVIITAVLAIVFPLFGLAPPDKMISYLKDISSIYTGIVGLIIGFYFGKP
jgi:hypothetical protein